MNFEMNMVHGKSRRKSSGDLPSISGHKPRSRIFSFGRDNAGFESDAKKSNSRKNKELSNLKAMMSSEFRRWATDNEINSNTLAILALEHFDSMATISMLRPDMVSMMGLSEDECRHLTQAIATMKKPPPPTPTIPRSFTLPTIYESYEKNNSKTDEIKTVAKPNSRQVTFSPTAHLIAQLHGGDGSNGGLPKNAEPSTVPIESGDAEQSQDRPTPNENNHMNTNVKLTPPSTRNRGELQGSIPITPVAHLISHLHRTENNTGGLFRVPAPTFMPPIYEEVTSVDENYISNFPSVHSLKRNEIDALLDKLLLDDVISVDIHEDITSECSLVARAGCLEIIIMSLSTQMRKAAHKWLERYRVGEERPGSKNRADKQKSPSNGHIANSVVKLPPGDSLENTGKINTGCDEDEIKRKEKIKNKELLLDISKFAVSDHSLRKASTVKTENECSVLDQMSCVCELQYKFGSKGKGHGQLEDATSISLLGHQIFVTDVINNRLQIFSKDGQPFGPVVLEDFSQPWNAATTRSSQQNLIAVTFKQSDCVVLLSETYEMLGAIRDDALKSPCGLAFDNKGKLIVSDVSTNRVHIFDLQTGKRSELNANIEFNQPSYVTVSPFNDVIISDTGNQCVKIFNCDGEFVRKFGALGREPGEFRCPYGLCTDSRGCILVADHYNNRICRFSRGGHFLSDLVTDDHGLIRPKDILMTDNDELFVSHGGMKASEIAKFQVFDETSLCWI